MKIVLISQNCYPKLGPRAHRTTELAKELARQGHEVTVYALLGDYDYSDFMKTTGVQLRSLGISKYGIPDNLHHYNKTLFNSLIRRTIGSFIEYPYVELIKMMKRVLREESEIDYLITVAHPHTIHWGAAKYINKNKNKIKFWVADCGDPYMKNPYNFRPFYFKYYEKLWGKLCNYISVPIEEAKTGYYSEFKNKIKVIPQGFNFENINLATNKKNNSPTFAYSGKVYRDKRDPTLFLKYLSRLECNFKFIIYTKQKDFYTPFMDMLGEKLELRPYTPREKLIYELSKMDFLINIKNLSEVQSPSKLIDYALTKRPILDITTEFHEKEQVDDFIKSNYREQSIVNDIEKYNIQNVANQFLELKS